VKEAAEFAKAAVLLFRRCIFRFAQNDRFCFPLVAFEPSSPAVPFTTLACLPTKEIFGGTIRGHYAHLDRLTIGEVTLAANTVLPMHQHPHEQVTYLLEGRFEFTVGEETVVLEPGMVALVPGGVMHGGKTLSACRVIDLFSPVREDYR
jgi:quercetin dioxygenase-like cupin family protein